MGVFRFAHWEIAFEYVKSQCSLYLIIKPDTTILFVSNTDIHLVDFDSLSVRGLRRATEGRFIG